MGRPPTVSLGRFTHPPESSLQKARRAQSMEDQIEREKGSGAVRANWPVPSKVTPVTLNAGRLGTSRRESTRLEQGWGEMPGHREEGQQETKKGGEERETKADRTAPTQGGRWLPTRTASRSLLWEPQPSLPRPASLWIPRAPQALQNEPRAPAWKPGTWAPVSYLPQMCFVIPRQDPPPPESEFSQLLKNRGHSRRSLRPSAVLHSRRA